MKYAMNLRFKKNVVVIVEDYSDEEDSESRRALQLVSRVLEKIEKGLQAFPNILGDNYIRKEDSGIEKVQRMKDLLII